MKPANLAGTASQRFERLCRTLAFAVPWLAALCQLSGTPTFAADAAVVRTFALAPVNADGVVSTWLGAALALLPFGGRVLRAEFVSAVALGLAGWLCARLSERLLRADGRVGALTAPLALMAALGVTLTPSFVLEGSAAGGHALGAALALGALDLLTARALKPGAEDARAALLLGALCSAAASESRWLGVALAAALALHFTLGAAPGRVALRWFGLGVAALALPALAALIVFHAPLSRATSTAALLSSSSPLQLAPVDASVVLGTWFSEVGVFGLALSLLGVGAALFNVASRRVLLPLLAVLAVDLILDAGKAKPVEHDAMLGMRLVALSGLAAAAALALARIIAYFERARVLLARPAGVLLVVYGFTLVLVSAEDSARAAQTRARAATEAWTDEALASLPAHSALLINSEAVLLRLLASQLTRGSRPDVLLVPLAKLAQGGKAATLFASERGFVPLVREMLLSGKPSEYALSALADARPTYIELDPAADARLTSHLLPRAFFSEFEAEPQARSDRAQDSAHVARTLARLRAQLEKAADGDPATRSVVVRALGERAMILAALGDREPALSSVEEALQLDPRDRAALDLKTRLQKPGKGRVDVSGLYASR